MRHIIATVILTTSAVLSVPASAEMAEDFKPIELKLSNEISESVRTQIVMKWNGLNFCLDQCLKQAVTCIELPKDPDGGGPRSCWEQHRQCNTSCFKQFPAP